VLAIATLGSIAAAAIALFGTWVAPKRGWFLALGYLGVLASLWGRDRDRRQRGMTVRLGVH